MCRSLLFSTVCFNVILLSCSDPTPPSERGQLLIPDKRLAFGAARDRRHGSDGWGDRGMRRGKGLHGRSLSVETVRSEKGSGGLKSRGGRGGRDGGLLGSQGRTEEEGAKMRSNRDLDSKTLRHNRQGFTPREPPPLYHSTSVKTITQSRGKKGPSTGMDRLLPLGSVFGLSI